MRKLVGLLVALLTFGLAAPAEAAQASQVRAEMPLMYDIRGNDPKHANLVAERLIQESLTKDSTGNGYIEGSPCTTPNDIYASVIQHHPEMRNALPSVEMLPAFFHALVPHLARADQGLTGSYPMSRMQCLRPGSRQSGDQLDPTDRAREFRMDEYAWYSPNFTDPVFAGDCTNVLAPISPPPPPPPRLAMVCDHIAFTVDTTYTAIRIAEAKKSTAAELTGDCPTMILRPKHTAYEKVWGVEECPEIVCNFADIEADVNKYGYMLEHRASFALVPGTYMLQVSRPATEVKQGNVSYPYLFIFCIESWQGPAPKPPVKGDPPAAFEAYKAAYRRFVDTHSDSSCVSGNDFLPQADGSRLATIYLNEEDAKRAGTMKLNKDANGNPVPTELWWHF